MRMILIMLLFFVSCKYEPLDKWPNGRVPYVLMGFTVEESGQIISCMTEWEDMVYTAAVLAVKSKGEDPLKEKPLKFIMNSPLVNDQGIEQDFRSNEDGSITITEAPAEPLYIIKRDGRYSYKFWNVGYDNRIPQVVFLASLDEGTIRHELGHVLGLIDEVNRPDRDEYITINWAGVDKLFPDNESMFDKCFYVGELGYEWWRFPYDYSSVMHYPSFPFDSNGDHVADSVVIDAHGYELPTTTDNMQINFLDARKVYDILSPARDEYRKGIVVKP